MSATPTQQQAMPAPGAYYGVPGMTLLTEQLAQNNGITATLSNASAVNVVGLQQFDQTDVVYWWEMEVAITQAFAVGGGVDAISPYAPYNFIGESRLRVQNQYAAWHPLSGIDAAIWQMFRPMRSTDQRTNMGANPAGAWDIANPNSGFAAATIPQSNLNASTAYVAGTTTVTFTLEMPASIMLDIYYDLDAGGNVLAAPHRAIVSPQYMAGAARSIQPQVTLQPGLGTGLDTVPHVVTGGAPTFTGTATLGFRRVGCYSQNNPASLPVVYNWQYGREATNFSLSGSSVKDLQVPTYGQILSLFVRLWDPAANAGKGAPISIANVTKCELRFGSGLFRFQDTPKSAQRRFVQQHGFLPPQGVIVWDLGLDEFGRTTNAYALNTLTTSGVLVHLEFSAAQSASAYAVLGCEFLNYVM